MSNKRVAIMCLLVIVGAVVICLASVAHAYAAGGGATNETCTVFNSTNPKNINSDGSYPVGLTIHLDALINDPDHLVQRVVYSANFDQDKGVGVLNSDGSSLTWTVPVAGKWSIFVQLFDANNALVIPQGNCFVTFAAVTAQASTTTTSTTVSTPTSTTTPPSTTSTTTAPVTIPPSTTTTTEHVELIPPLVITQQDAASVEPISSQVATTATPPATLPETGKNHQEMLKLSFALFVSGLTLLWIGRRRRSLA